jgi:phage terminase large subunit-like protein
MTEHPTSCLDWERRVLAGDSLITSPPLFPESAAAGLSVFKSLHIKDVLGCPTYGQVGRQWQFDFVSSIFGSYDPVAMRRIIKEYFLMVAKKNDKSGMAAAIMMTALILNDRESAEFFIIAPTVEVAGNSFKPACGMISSDEELSDLMQIQEHIRQIKHRNTGSTLKIVAAESDTVGGIKGAGVLIEELWLFGKRPNALNMFVEAKGGLLARPEGFIVNLTTQSDEAPAGVFASGLEYARGVRDGKIDDPAYLPVLYEFPKRIVETKEYLNPKMFYVVNPNLGASVDEATLVSKYNRAEIEGIQEMQGFLAKHLNIQISTSLRAQNWAGADFWEAAAGTVTLDLILEKSDVVVIGIDGGGLDDLLGLAVLGRDATEEIDVEVVVEEAVEYRKGNVITRRPEKTLTEAKPKQRKWLLWTCAWMHPIALERRKSEAARYRDFEKDGDLIIVEEIGQDIKQAGDIVRKCEASGLLDRIGVDQAGIGAIADEIEAGDEKGDGAIEHDRIVGIPQGWRLNGAIKTLERKVAEKSLVHGGQALMAWCVGNAKVEPRGNAISITKQASGTGKIDPLMAAFNCCALMAMNPEAKSKKSAFDGMTSEEIQKNMAF